MKALPRSQSCAYELITIMVSMSESALKFKRIYCHDRWISFFNKRACHFFWLRNLLINECGLAYGCPMEQGRPLYFCPVVSFFLSSFFSSPNLSCCRLDAYHTSTHGVALVQIQNAGLKCAASGWLEIQDAKMMQKIAI